MVQSGDFSSIDISYGSWLRARRDIVPPCDAGLLKANIECIKIWEFEYAPIGSSLQRRTTFSGTIPYKGAILRQLVEN